MLRRWNIRLYLYTKLQWSVCARYDISGINNKSDIEDSRQIEKLFH